MLQALLNGAALFPFDIEAEGLTALRNWIRDEEITVYHSVPAVFRSLVKTFGGRERFPLVRHVRLGGDTIRREDVELFQRHFEPPCRLRIGYSCTEAGVITCHFIDTATPIGEGAVPVGRVVEEVSVRLLDESDREVAAGEAGEITVRSRHLALGYWRREELTRERFRPDPDGGPERIFSTGDLGRFRPDGLLVHLGRKDFQVKVRGFRIETGEVEAALRTLPGVEDAAVAAPTDASGERHLVGYLVWKGPALSARAVRAALLKTLPDQMVPAAYVTLPRLPLTARGKVDIKALPPPPSDGGGDPGSEVLGPRNDLERQLAEIWARLLKRERVDIRSDFFEMGGTPFSPSSCSPRSSAGWAATCRSPPSSRRRRSRASPSSSGTRRRTRGPRLSRSSRPGRSPRSFASTPRPVRSSATGPCPADSDRTGRSTASGASGWRMAGPGFRASRRWPPGTSRRSGPSGRTGRTTSAACRAEPRSRSRSRSSFAPREERWARSS
jgi:hypothetical protein